jgi:dTDP-4-dehydrorhamnose 3,5-epimerase
MIDALKIKNLDKFSDKRGWLAELFRDDETEYRPAMAYASMTNPGIIRGPHEHAHQSDYFIFVGPGSFEVHLWDRREESPTKGEYMKIEAGENNPCAISVPPGVVHGYKCVSEIPAYSINLPDRLYRGKNKAEVIDEVRWETDPDSPYKII